MTQTFTHPQVQYLSWGQAFPQPRKQEIHIKLDNQWPLAGTKLSMWRQLNCTGHGQCSLLLPGTQVTTCNQRGRGSSGLIAQPTLRSANKNAALQYPQVQISTIWGNISSFSHICYPTPRSPQREQEPRADSSVQAEHTPATDLTDAWGEMQRSQ